MALALKGVDWQAIRDAYILGVTSTEIAERFGVSDSLVRVRAARGKWSSPARVRAVRASKLAAEAVDPVNPDAVVSVERGPVVVSRHVADGVKGSETATEMAAEGLPELGASGSLIGARLLHGLLNRAARAPGKLAPLRDAGDVVTAVKGLRSAAGIDRPESAVQVNVALFGGAGSGSDGCDA